MPPVSVGHRDVVVCVERGQLHALVVQRRLVGVGRAARRVGAVLELVVLGPLLLERVLQHLDAAHEAVLQVLLALALALKEGDSGLEREREKCFRLIGKMSHISALKTFKPIFDKDF